MEEKKQQTTTSGTLKPLHTYSSDMADAVRENEASVIKIALAEQRRHEREDLYREAQGSKPKKIFWALGGVVLLLAAVAIGYYVLVVKKNADTALPTVQKQNESLVAYDVSAAIDATQSASAPQLSQRIDAEVKNLTTPGAVKLISITEPINGIAEQVTTARFLSLIKATAPLPLVRSFTDRFMLGAYLPAKDGARPNLFLIAKTSDYAIAYAGMLAWEKTMLRDFFTLFATDVSGSRSSLFERSFKDIILKNKDARILYDTEGNDVLYYIFPSKDTVIITDSQDTIQELSSRLLIQNARPL